MKKIITISIAIIVMNLPISCSEDDCGGTVPYEPRITALTTTIGSYSSDKFNSTRSTNYQQAAIRILITDNEFIKVAKVVPSTFSFVNRAYACSPAIADPNQQITSMEITAKESIFSNGNEFKPGTSLNALFHVSNMNKLNIQNFIDKQNGAPIIFGDLSDDIILMLIDAPDEPVNQKLNIEFEFNIGESFQLETDFLKIDA